MPDQAVERVTESEFRSQTKAAEKAAASLPQPDEVVTAVRARAKNRVRCTQFFQSQPQQ